MSDVCQLVARAPAVNTILRDYTTVTSAGIKHYSNVHGLSKEEEYILAHKSDLNNLKLKELQELGKKYGIGSMKPSDKAGKLKFKTKDELTREILSEASPSS